MAQRSSRRVGAASVNERLEDLELRIEKLENQAQLWNLTKSLVFAAAGTALTAAGVALLKSIGLMK